MKGFPVVLLGPMLGWVLPEGLGGAPLLSLPTLSFYSCSTIVLHSGSDVSASKPHETTKENREGKFLPDLPKAVLGYT